MRGEVPQTDHRYTYTTPKTYLEFIYLYKNMLLKQREKSERATERLENGLQKLRETAEAVTQLEADLKVSLEAAEVKKTKAEGIAETVATEKAIVEKETAAAEVEAKKCEEIKVEVTRDPGRCGKDFGCC